MARFKSILDGSIFWEKIDIPGLGEVDLFALAIHHLPEITFLEDVAVELGRVVIDVQNVHGNFEHSLQALVAEDGVDIKLNWQMPGGGVTRHDIREASLQF